MPIGILDAAFGFAELGVLTGLSGTGWKEEWTAKALGQKAVGVPKLIAGKHA